MTRWTILALLVAGCSVTPYRPLPPRDGEGTCTSAAENAARLGGCGVGDDFESNCRDAQAAEAEVGVRLPVGCMTSASTCEELRACR